MIEGYEIIHVLTAVALRLPTYRLKGVNMLIKYALLLLKYCRAWYLNRNVVLLHKLLSLQKDTTHFCYK